MRTFEDFKAALEGFENFPLTEDQQSLVNYLRANVDDVAEHYEFEEETPGSSNDIQEKKNS